MCLRLISVPTGFKSMKNLLNLKKFFAFAHLLLLCTMYMINIILAGYLGLGDSIPCDLHGHIHPLRSSISSQRARLQWQVLGLLRVWPHRHHRPYRWYSCHSEDMPQIAKNIWKVFKTFKFVWNSNWFSKNHKCWPSKIQIIWLIHWISRY